MTSQSVSRKPPPQNQRTVTHSRPSNRQRPRASLPKLLAVLLTASCSPAVSLMFNIQPTAASAASSASTSDDDRMPQYQQLPRDPLLLTPYISAGDTEVGRNLSKVKGFEPLDGIENYAGYLTINATSFSNMFFWYFPAERLVRGTSVIIWLEGGPGAASSMNVILDNGPIAIDEESQKIVRRRHYWSEEHHVIYIDQPLGVGYSFTDPSGRPTSIEETTDDLYAAVLQLYALFPDLRLFPLYLAGQSYAGKFIPALAKRIGEANEAFASAQSKAINLTGLGSPNSVGDQTTGSCRPIPLEGLILGNPMIHPKQNFYYGDYLYSHGLIDEIQRDHFESEAEEANRQLDSGALEDAVDIMDRLIFGAFHNDTYFKQATGFDQYHSVRGPRDTYLFTQTYETADRFLQSPMTRARLNVGEMPFLAFSEDVLRNLKEDMALSQLANFEYALNSYRVMLYYGNLDIICNFEAGRRIMADAKTWERHREWLRTVQKPWKPRMSEVVKYEIVGVSVDNSHTMHMSEDVTFGFVTHLPRLPRSRSEFVFLVVLGAAHSVLQDRPELMQHALNSFLRGDDF